MGGGEGRGDCGAELERLAHGEGAAIERGPERLADGDLHRQAGEAPRLVEDERVEADDVGVIHAREQARLLGQPLPRLTLGAVVQREQLERHGAHLGVPVDLAREPDRREGPSPEPSHQPVGPDPPLGFRELAELPQGGSPATVHRPPVFTTRARTTFIATVVGNERPSAAVKRSSRRAWARRPRATSRACEAGVR